MPLNDLPNTKTINPKGRPDTVTRPNQFSKGETRIQVRDQSSNRRPLADVSNIQEEEIPKQPPSKREIAESMKLPIPPATLQTRRGPSSVPMKHQVSQSTDSDLEQPSRTTSTDSLQATEPVYARPKAAAVQSTEYNDEDSTFTFGDDGYSTDEDQHSEKTAFRRPADLDMQQLRMNEGFREEAVARFGPMFSATLQSNRTVQIEKSPNDQPDDADSLFDDDEFEEDTKDVVIRELQKGTPSRAASVPIRAVQPVSSVSKVQQKKVTILPQGRSLNHPSSPLQSAQHRIGTETNLDSAQRSSIARHHDYRKTIPATEPHQQPSNPFNTPAKISGHNEGSEDERAVDLEQAQSPLMKRLHEDIDYSEEQLLDMRYSELDRLPFLTDPRRPVLQPTVESMGAPMSLSDRLRNLTKLQPKDQEMLFCSLSDEENEQVGEWFVQKFQEDLKRLMATRLERRKVALKYEMEVKKCEAAVQAKSRDVEAELGELKAGGGKLMAGRSAQGIGATPKAKK